MPKRNRVLTAPLTDAIVFASGGTTGHPKYSYYTNSEWEHSISLMSTLGTIPAIQHGDRVANLFYSGNLYASFLTLQTILSHGYLGAVHFPISGVTKVDKTIEILLEHDINVLAGTPTTLLKIVDYIKKNTINNIHLDGICFAGETFYPDQRHFIQSVYPDIIFSSLGYASVDASTIGVTDQTCGLNEHRSIDPFAALEIIDEQTGKPIIEEGKAGKIITTDFTRTLMPIIRYPTGDIGKWVEPVGTPHRKFMLLGRSEVALRVGVTTIYPEDIQTVLKVLDGIVSIKASQSIITHFDQKDCLTMLLVADQQPDPSIEEILRKKMYEIRPMFLDSVQKKFIHDLRVRFVSISDLEINPRTGKLRSVIDKRLPSETTLQGKDLFISS